MDFYFNDTDYADWFVLVKPEHDQDLYFYYDTFASKFVFIFELIDFDD